MGDRVPISTWPGLANALVGTDIIVVPTDIAPFTVVHVFLQRNGNQAGDAIAATLQTETGGAGDSIAVNLAAGEASLSNSAALEVSAGDGIYLRVASADTNSENLRGWIEIEGGTAAITAQLTTLTRVKQYLGKTGSGEDAILNQLIVDVSAEIQQVLGNRIIANTRTDEPVDSIGTYQISLSQHPVISVSSLEENQAALVEDTDWEMTEYDQDAGLLQRISGGYPIAWAKGKRAIRVTYSHGYSTVPEDIAKFATVLVVYDYLQTQPGGKRISLADKVVDSGGTSSYRSRQDIWTDYARATLRHRRL